MFKKELISIVCCPDCRGDLEIKKNILFCSSCATKFPIMDGIPVLLPSVMQNDVKLSMDKWDMDYKKKIDRKKMLELKSNYESTYSSPEMKYLKSAFGSFKNKKYLEIGSGTFFIGQKLAKEGSFVTGIDFSMNALRLAKFYLDEEKIDNYLLVCGDITKMPFKDNVFDVLYGGGVIEHFKDTVGVVKENYRVIKKGGVAFNTVPYLNLGSLTYRQAWGNIPNAPILRNIAEFVHMRLLKGRRMIYGYEFSFTKGKLRTIFLKSGFSNNNIEIEKFEVPLLFEYIKIGFLKKIAAFMANSNLFWPVLYIKSKK